MNHQTEAVESTELAADYDKLFPMERREEMLKGASRDREGRPVVYYRYMPQAMLDKLVDQGDISALDHFDDPDEPLDERPLAQRLSSWLDDQEGPNSEAFHNYWDVKSALPELGERNPGLAEGLGALATSGAFTPRELHPLLDKHFDRGVLKRIHTAGDDRKFSPFMSLSVGSIIRDKLREGQVYVEFVIPDEFVEAQPEGIPVEKEVLARTLRRGWITRVYTTNEQLHDEIIANPETPVGKWYQRYPVDAVDQWRTNEPTEDYLPEALLY